MSDILPLNDPVIFSDEIVEEMADLDMISTEIVKEPASDPIEVVEESSEIVQETVYVPVLPDDILTNEVYLNGVNELATLIDPDSVLEDVIYVDRGSYYALGSDLPDYAVVYECNGVEVVFPTDYADDLLVSDGMLINLGSNYTAGLQIDGYSVNNYLSSELTIPTYHSATWYQYLQTYGQPYRIVDRYVNNYGSISSSTRESVSVEWSGGNPWQGFTFERIAIFLILIFIAFMFLFRKGK